MSKSIFKLPLDAFCSIPLPIFGNETIKTNNWKKNCFITFGSYFQQMQKHLVKRGFTSYSAVELKSGDSIGLGMVREGTKCGRNKVRYHGPLFNTLSGFVPSCRLLILYPNTISHTCNVSCFINTKPFWKKNRPLSYTMIHATSHIRKHFSVQSIHRKNSMEEHQPLGHKS